LLKSNFALKGAKYRAKSQKHKEKKQLCTFNFQLLPGGASRDRTDDLLLAKQALSQLSYGPRKEVKSLKPKAKRVDLPSLFTFDFNWWVWVDLNHRPHPYQGCALTN
jgi:hypothetical protein